MPSCNAWSRGNACGWCWSSSLLPLYFAPLHKLELLLTVKRHSSRFVGIHEFMVTYRFRTSRIASEPSGFARAGRRPVPATSSSLVARNPVIPHQIQRIHRRYRVPAFGDRKAPLHRFMPRYLRARDRWPDEAARCNKQAKGIREAIVPRGWLLPLV
jgi:hypothetical protein